MQESINNLNKSLVVLDNRCDLIDYIKEINKLHKNPIDLSFMEELLGFVTQDEPCVPHTLLVKYGVLSDTNLSKDTRRLLEQYDFTEENNDFKLGNVAELGNNGKTYYMKDYFLHPETFKYCLMRAKNTKVYAKYYLLLEKSIKYYHDFQLMYKDHLLKQKDDVITNMSKKIDELLGVTHDMKDDISTLLEFSTEQAEEAEISNTQYNIAVTDRINEPINTSKIEHMVVLKYKNNTYYVIRGILSYIKLRYKVLTKRPYHTKQTETNYIFIKEYCNVPNARHLFRALSNNKNIISSGNTFEIINITEEEALELIQEVFDKRLTVEIEYKDQLNARNKANKKVGSIKIRSQ